jgi:hypothetical protein
MDQHGALDYEEMLKLDMDDEKHVWSSSDWSPKPRSIWCWRFLKETATASQPADSANWRLGDWGE